MTDPRPCPDCAAAPQPSRRELLKRTAGVVAASAGIVSLAPTWSVADVADQKIVMPKAASETLVAQLYKSLKEGQKKAICFPFDHAKRSDIDNNWFIVKEKVKGFFDKDQQALIREIFLSMHSEEYAGRVLAQVEHDNKDIGGLGGCAVALFGEPGETGDGKSKFEFVLTGRHTTRRCDGNSVAGAAFGGPIFYGHAAGTFTEKADHAGNAYWFQAVRANEVYKALDGRQRKLALLDITPPGEHGKDTVELPTKKEDLDGIPMTELSADQKGLVRKVLADLLAPFRKADADEALALIDKAGFDKLRMAFFSKMDVGNDGVWDVWKIESENMVWYFRGAPHVHTWVHIREG
ncbi:MAG TPA: DUF3500 domain-containing protein [Tepidisphaeraceae bacterium]|nr:DUF3500 domain-containing protein [Tepidisphaeraceae bacterium]